VNIKDGIGVLSVSHGVPAGLPLNTKLAVDVSTPLAERFHRKSVMLRGYKKLRHSFLRRSTRQMACLNLPSAKPIFRAI